MPERVLRFWFEEIDRAAWWRKDPAFDRMITQRFAELHERARRCELHDWRREARGRLAEIIVLDQFSRNMYRDRPEAFANDSLALALAQEAIASGADARLGADERAFLYMPFMHSESSEMHEWALALFSASGLESTLAFELEHKTIVDRFGRYPHRNAILGRKSTPEELTFLAQAGARF